jgi:DNA-binding GntR family transcriptional regulator
MTLSSDIIERLRNDILKGAIVPGARLRADELRLKYAVSLTPVREALMRLAAQGLVIAEDQRGFHVAPISRANLKEVNGLRTMLECLALRKSIELGNIDWESNVVATLHKLEAYSSRRKDDATAIDDGWERCHRAFHMALIEGCGMPLLLDFCRSLHDLADRYRRVFLPLTRRVDRQKEHERIAAAACKRDVELAVKHLTKHIALTETLVLEAFDRQN